MSLVLKRVGSVEHGGREQIECVVEIQFTRVARDEQSIRERHGQRDELIDLGRPQRREGTPIEACDAVCRLQLRGSQPVHWVDTVPQEPKYPLFAFSRLRDSRKSRR